MAKKPAVITAFLVVAAAVILAWLLWPRERGRELLPAGAAEAGAAAKPGAESTRVGPRSPIAPRPFTEAPESAETTAATRPIVEIEVVDEDGGAAAGARIFAYRDETVLADLVCGTDGVVRFAASPEDADVVVNLEGAAVHHERLSLSAGRRRIELPRGAAIMGSVEVDGGAPTDPIALRLMWVTCDEWIDRVPSAVGNHLSHFGRRRQVAVSTRADGRFRFSGLPIGWSGGIYLRSDDYVFEGLPTLSPDDESPHMAVTAPAEGLTLRLHRWPVLSGRVVAADTHAPIPSATIQATILSDSGHGTGRYLHGDDQGRFHLSLGVWHVVRITLDVQDASGLGGKELDRRGEFQHDVDLGDIELGAVRSVAFVAKDVTGAPIAGAVAATWPRATWPRTDVLSQPTNASGASTIRIDTDGGMRVSALGFDSVDVTVPHELLAPLVVTLPRGTRLDVQLASPSGAVPPGISVSLKVRRPWFEASATWPDPALVAAGTAPALGWGLSSDGFYAGFRPDARGRLVLAGIKAGVAFDIEAHDDLSGFGHTDHLTLEAGETREHVIVVDRPWHSFRGVVRDGKGSPLPGAYVMVFVAYPKVDTKDTDAAGRFVFDAIYADRVDVTIAKEGFATLVSKMVELPAPGAETVFVMTPGRQITVTIVDAAGQLVRASSVVAEVPGSPEVTGRREPSGAFFLANLPEATVNLRATVGGRAYTQSHDTRLPTARIVVPAHGSLQVSWEFRLEPGSTNQLRLEPAAAGGPALAEFVQNSEEMVRGDFTLPSVLPGEYLVWLEAKVFDPMSDGGEFHALSRRTKVTVTVGAAAKAVLIQ